MLSGVIAVHFPQGRGPPTPTLINLDKFFIFFKKDGAIAISLYMEGQKDIPSTVFRLTDFPTFQPVADKTISNPEKTYIRLLANFDTQQE
ncbi:hypothetical protein DSO57_1014400 [Entomophthora muscae]|uniref:Uncharacterized protein n=1 Tax=Entomophthora muscae TaxID=34485 RepID=A0ACC2UEZ8_9FUNG|nr:hypothetical protein DSO57_1014400 [Entomophthora muscae]